MIDSHGLVGFVSSTASKGVWGYRYPHLTLKYVWILPDLTHLYKHVRIPPESTHPHDTQVTHTLYASRTRLTSVVYAPDLHAQFTRYVQDLQSHFTRVKSTRLNYVYNIRAQLTHTIYVLVWRARIIRLSLVRTSYTPILHVQSTRPTYAIRHVIRRSLVRILYT